jgi:hypothetical protein
MIGKPEPPRDRGCGGKPLLRCGCVASTDLRFREREQELAACQFVVRSREVECLERDAVEPFGLLVGEQLERALCRPLRAQERLLELARRDRMVREFREMRTWVVAVEPFERADDEAVEADAPCCSQVVVERVADEDVREPKTSRCARHLEHDPCEHRLVECVEQLVG